MLTSHRVRRHVDQTMGEAVVAFITKMQQEATEHEQIDSRKRIRLVAVVPVKANTVDVIVSEKTY